jgi:hypothetical protein
MIYEATITFTKPDDKGDEKTFKDSYILENQDLFTQVESKLYEEFEGYKDFDVVAIKRSNIKEIANQRTSNDDVVWQAEVQDIFHDDEGNEKLLKYKILFFSKTYESANTFITEYAKQGYDMSLVSLKLTKFIDVL